MKTVTEIRRSNACKTFIAASVYLIVTYLCVGVSGVSGETETEE